MVSEVEALSKKIDSKFAERKTLADSRRPLIENLRGVNEERKKLYTRRGELFEKSDGLQRQFAEAVCGSLLLSLDFDLFFAAVPVAVEFLTYRKSESKNCQCCFAFVLSLIFCFS